MAPRHPVRTVIGLAALLACGCGASGRDWVRAPEPGGFDDAHAELAPPRSATAFESSAAPTTGRPRLTESITLGESTSAAPRERPTAGEPRSVVVTVNNYVTPGVASPYGGVVDDFFFRSRAAAAARPRPSTTVPAIGQDWPAPPNSGPPFPYSTLPASPWNGRR